MTIKVSGSSLSMSEINAEFALGNNLNVHRGVGWYLDNVQKGTFPSGAISFSDFYSKRKTTPVTAGSATVSATGNYTVPLYETLTVTVYGGRGGQSGQQGSGCAGVSASSPGGNGAGSSFGAFASAAGGTGGSGNLVAGSQPSSVTTFTNPLNGGTGPATGAVVAVTCGGGGAGGGGGTNTGLVPSGCSTVCAAISTAASGAAGATGSVVISWS